MNHTHHKELPKDVQNIDRLLRSCGIESYDPQVVNQLLEVATAYTRQVLSDASDLRDHACAPVATNSSSSSAVSLLYQNPTRTPRTNEITVEDVEMAVQMRLQTSYLPSDAISRGTGVIAEAKIINRMPLPTPSSRSGPSLPPPKLCVTDTNYQILVGPARDLQARSAAGGHPEEVEEANDAEMLPQSSVAHVPTTTR